MKTINVVAAIDLTLLEHEDARWLAMEELDSVHWLPADREMVDAMYNVATNGYHRNNIESWDIIRCARNQ